MTIICRQLCRTWHFFAISGHDHSQYSLYLPTEEWPSCWPGLLG